MRFTTRTGSSTLFVNPLMTIYFSFTVAGLASRVLYLDLLEDTVSMPQVQGRIEWFRAGITPRAARPYPH